MEGSIIDEIYIDGLEIIGRLGKGNFSTVFLGKLNDDQQVSVKVVENDESALNHEIGTLNKIKGCKNATQIIDDIPQAQQYPIIITSYEDGSPLLNIYKDLNIENIKSILKNLLQCLQSVHSRKVVHQDITFANIIVSPDYQKATLIDWGCGNSVIENRMSPYIGSRLYRSPEMLIGFRNYATYADMWSVGVIILLMLTKYVFPWNASNADNELIEMSKIFGGDTILKYASDVLHITVKQKIQDAFTSNSTTQFEDFFSEETKSLQDPILIDLMKKLLVLDMNQRLTAEEALQHPFFQSQ